jgi:hypothetical protein
MVTMEASDEELNQAALGILDILLALPSPRDASAVLAFVISFLFDATEPGYTEEAVRAALQRLNDVVLTDWIERQRAEAKH